MFDGIGDSLDMFGRYGVARFRFSQYDCVSEARRTWTELELRADKRYRITQENKLGQRFIGASDFLKNGIPASLLATFVIVTVGYAIMRLLG